MTQSILLVAVTSLVTWLVMNWVRPAKHDPKPLSFEEREANRAKDIGTMLDGARDRASLAEIEGNKLALAKAVKAALWVTEARLNAAVPELLTLAQHWIGKSELQGKKRKLPEGVTEIEGEVSTKTPWASWSFNQQHWRIEAHGPPSILPDEIKDEIGTYRVSVDHEIVLDMALSGTDKQVMWIDALTVGPWVSDLLTFAGAQTSDAQARSSERSKRKNQDRADNIRWS